MTICASLGRNRGLTTIEAVRVLSFRQELLEHFLLKRESLRGRLLHGQLILECHHRDWPILFLLMMDDTVDSLRPVLYALSEDLVGIHFDLRFVLLCHVRSYTLNIEGEVAALVVPNSLVQRGHCVIHL